MASFLSMTLSVIVPVYNVEDYLPKCLQSLDHQGLDAEGFEVILVNDGSTDGSLRICEDFAKTHKNVRLLNQSNQGVAAARNKGIDAANGEYVIFVDSDDFLADNGLKQIAEVISSHPEAELIRYYSSYSFHQKDGNAKEIDYQGKAEGLLKAGGYPAFVWTYAYKKSFLDKNSIRFQPLRFSEDGLFIATVYLHNPYVVSTKANIYRYVLRQDSAIGSRSKEKSRACAEDGITAYEKIREELAKSVFSNNVDVIRACTSSENFKKNACYSRLLGADYNRKDFSLLKQRIKKDEFYPIVPTSDSRKAKIMCDGVNFMFSCYPVYKLSSFLFIHIFTPYVLPRYRKKVWSKA